MSSQHKKPTTFLLMCALLIVGFYYARSMAQSQKINETTLHDAGLVHELFRAPNGELWISDFLADEMWRVNPTSGAYTVYENILGASNGRIDGSGNLWWSDFDGNGVGRLVPGQTQATLWPLPGDGSPLGLAFDSSGQVWISDVFEPTLYRFATAQSQLCRYTIPNSGTADYLLFHDGHVWLSDANAGYIRRLNPTNGQFSSWQLPAGAYPQGLAVEQNGRIWWGDPALGVLGRLDPQTNQMTLFTPPALSGPQAEPQMVSVSQGQIWYTDRSGRLGSLNPQQASASPSTQSPATTTVSPSCGAIGAPSSIPVTTSTGTVTWSPADYPLVYNSAGWLVYNLPAGAAPWGIATAPGEVFLADQGTVDVRPQKLGWLELGSEPPPTVTPGSGDYSVYLPAILGDQ